MDPTAFRAQLLQNFRVRLGPGELGAVFTAFDKDNSKLIDGTEVCTRVASAPDYHHLKTARVPRRWRMPFLRRAVFPPRTRSAAWFLQEILRVFENVCDGQAQRQPYGKCR